ncbi:hypothetical protein [Aneurinibacillus soli]|uniref:hypothetical protein n=1 Tax=Aneurinibacillus soli TaxID=1500254 RepID=UPI0015E8A45D|nr:hypothetical protein [Aneurinibacillus soli]
MVEDRDRAGPRHFGTLATEWGLSAPGATRTRPQNMPTMYVQRSVVGKGPFV